MNTAEQILKHLRTSGKTVATAESITAGHVQAMLASVSGASDVFLGGITAYRRAAKVELLEVDDDLALRTNCIDEAIAQQLALGALKRFHSDYALATCGYAEVETGAPFAYIAVVAAPSKLLFSARVELYGNRVEAQQEAARAVLDQFLTLLSEG